MTQSDARVTTTAGESRPADDEMADLQQHQSTPTRGGNGDCGDVSGTGALADVTGRAPAPKSPSGDAGPANAPASKPVDGSIGHLGRKEPGKSPVNSASATEPAG